MMIHTAGVAGDGVTGAPTVPRGHAVMRAKADAAWNPHELVRDIDLQAFALFSSVEATFGGSDQGNYAAANAPPLLRGLVRARPGAPRPAAVRPPPPASPRSKASWPPCRPPIKARSSWT